MNSTLHKQSVPKKDIGFSSVKEQRSDSELWESFMNGSEAAFVEIYNIHFQTLYSFGRNFTGQTGWVMDCLQEVFITIREKRSTLPKVRSIKAYLLMCLRNKLISEIKKKKKTEELGQTTVSLDFTVVPSPENLMINREIRKDRLRRIEAVLETLSNQKREALYYFYHCDLTYTEIQEIMGYGSVRAIRNLIYRTLKEIRNKVVPRQ